MMNHKFALIALSVALLVTGCATVGGMGVDPELEMELEYVVLKWIGDFGELDEGPKDEIVFKVKYDGNRVRLGDEFPFMRFKTSETSDRLLGVDYFHVNKEGGGFSVYVLIEWIEEERTHGTLFAVERNQQGKLSVIDHYSDPAQ